MEGRPSILVPVRVLEGESIPDGVPELLANAHVVLLGYHVVPDQTATDQARDQFEARALARLGEYGGILGAAGAEVESRLVFTHRGQRTIDRMVTEHGCLAVLIPNATAPPEDVLVAVRGTVGLDRFVRLLVGLFEGTGIGITLYHVAEERETDEDVTMLLDGIAGRLAGEGIESASIETQVARDRNPQAAIVDDAGAFDAVVMGESDPSVATLVFGMRAEKVAKRFLGPVFVVQRRNPAL